MLYLCNVQLKNNRKIMIKDKTKNLIAIEFSNNFSLCAYINNMNEEIDIINITQDNGNFTIFYLENKK